MKMPRHLVRLSGFVAALTASCLAIAAPVHVAGTAFKDDQGRTLILRGVNLGGSSKIPLRPSRDPARVSFVGRPFPLSQADEHFRRLQSWGLTVERLIVPWEALEHAGPGQYDLAYLAYLHALIKRADRYGIKMVIDLHQDFYSRASGGDGAPYWTLTRLGLQPDHTDEPGALQPQPPRGPGYWPPTSARLAVDTMDALFWAGNDLAPGLQVDGVPVQEWLQGHYLGALRKAAESLHDLPNIIGYDSFNEPQAGLLGVQDLHQPEILMMVIGHYAAPGVATPSYWDLIQAAAGYAPGHSTVPANRLWANPAQDIWRHYGVWDVVDGKPKLLKPDYFARIAGKVPEHNAYLRPFYLRVVETVRAVAPDALVFEEPSAVSASSQAMDLGQPGVVNEPHFYDNVTLLAKQYTPETTMPMFASHPITGKDAVLAAYARQLRGATTDAAGLAALPVWIGETGIPFDMNGKEAYRTGNFASQEALGSLMFAALDRALLSYAIWNYAADNSNPAGDHWNQEDLSIYSPDQRHDPANINSGGRALKAVVRPYPVATAGTPMAIAFDPDTRTFVFRFRADPGIKAPTEIFMPRFQYPQGYEVQVANGHDTMDPAHSLLEITDAHDDVTVTVTPHSAASK